MICYEKQQQQQQKTVDSIEEYVCKSDTKCSLVDLQ